jgi:hypothetical protein
VIAPTETGPPPFFRSFDQTCPQRIPFDVSNHGQQVIILLNGKGLETPLPEMPKGAMKLAIPMRVS